MTTYVNAEMGIAEENKKCIKVGALKSSNAKFVTIDKTKIYLIADIIEMAGFAVPESVRTNAGPIDSTAILPENCSIIALGITNVKAGWYNYEDEDDEYYDGDEDEEDEDEDEDDEPTIVSSPVNEEVPCEFRRCIKVGALKSSNSVTITIDKRKIYTVAQVIEAAGFDVPESVRTDAGLIEASALLPERAKIIALGITKVKAGL